MLSSAVLVVVVLVRLNPTVTIINQTNKWFYEWYIRIGSEFEMNALMRNLTVTKKLFDLGVETSQLLSASDVL